MAPRSELNAKKRVPDPVWGQIDVTQAEDDIMYSKAFNRLRYIKQMGFSFLSYHGATHTRWEHSIGTMFVVDQLYKMFREYPQKHDHIMTRKYLRIAALLHDIGHAPFSHAVEEAFKKYPHLLEFDKTSGAGAKTITKIIKKYGKFSHEGFTRYIIENDFELNKILKKNLYDPTVISQLAVGDATDNKLSPFNELIDGDFDADKIDYLSRDCYQCGIQQRVDLNGFQGSLILGDNQAKKTPRIYLSPKAISSVSSLLLTRYKLIKDVHNIASDRIATQMLVEKIRLWLESLSPAKRAEVVVSLHSKFTDTDLEKELEAFEDGPEMQDILRKHLYDSKQKFSYSWMHPSVKASCHIILNNPEAITTLQDKVRSVCKDSTILLDIREPKPPKISTLLLYDDDEYDEKKRHTGSIFDRFATPRGILIDSFQDLAMYLYAPKESRVNIGAKLLSKLEKELPSIPSVYSVFLEGNSKFLAINTVEVGRLVRDDASKNSKILDIDLILLFLHTIDEWSKDVFDGERLWVYSDSALQRFLHKVHEQCLKRKIFLLPVYKWDDYPLSSKVSRNLEKLRIMGLIEVSRKTIPHPAFGWTSRIDRRISGWGKSYVTEEIANLHHPLAREIRVMLNSVKQLLSEIIQLESEILELDTPGEISEREPLNKEIFALRGKLKKENIASLTIG